MKHKKITVIVLTGALLAGAAFGAFAAGQSETTQPGTSGTNQTAPAYGGYGPRGWTNQQGTAQPNQQWGRGPANRPGYMMGYQFNKEDEVTVEGKLYYENLMHPELKTGSEEYELLVPRHLVYEAGIEDGTVVKVTGYKVANPPMDNDKDSEEEIHLFVTKAEINGKEYDIRSEIGAVGMGPAGRAGTFCGPIGRMGGRPGYSGRGRTPGWGYRN